MKTYSKKDYQYIKSKLNKKVKNIVIRYFLYKTNGNLDEAVNNIDEWCRG